MDEMQVGSRVVDANVMLICHMKRTSVYVHMRACADTVGVCAGFSKKVHVLCSVEISISQISTSKRNRRHQQHEQRRQNKHQCVQSNRLTLDEGGQS